jgi:hypothetical protein
LTTFAIVHSEIPFTEQPAAVAFRAALAVDSPLEAVGGLVADLGAGLDFEVAACGLVDACGQVGEACAAY